MSDKPAPPTGAMSTSTLGSAPVRKRHREDHIEYAYTLQRDAAIKGMVIWGLMGASSCFLAHHLFPGFRRQTLALKGFITSGVGIFGFVIGAEQVLQHHENQQRTEENIIRDRARKELGRKGIVASEKEIDQWRIDERDKLLKRLREERERSREQPQQEPVSLEGEETQ